MFKILLVFFIGMTPWLISLWILYKTEARTRERLRAARLSVGSIRIGSTSNQPEEQYIQGVGYIIGDLTCKFNARSPVIRCAVNPMGPCKDCSHYESRDIHC
ncbi:MAG: DUF6464 family protein [Microcoleaceae cyanobacterium]